MGIHKSLVSKGRLRRHRNVLSRTERLLKLEDEEKWSEEDSVFALPKVRVARLKKSQAKKEKKEEEGAEGAPAAEGAGATAEGAAAAAAAAPADKGTKAAPKK